MAVLAILITLGLCVAFIALAPLWITIGIVILIILAGFGD